ncbi:MAG: NAD-dependent epimerase/dehydratase family protein, partial [Candidatus Bilamarchaeaceae archaeon]
MKTYITGASGRLGRSVFRKIRAVPLVRRPCGLKGEIVTDFSPESLKGVLQDAGCLIHLAGSMKTWDHREMIEANVALTKVLALNSPQNCHFILASSISIYGKKMAQIPASEETPPRPDSAYSASKLACEAIASKKESHCILRLGTLYGPAFLDYFAVLQMLERGRMPIFGDGKNRVPFTHVEDVAAVFPRALKKKGIFVLSGPAETQENIYKIACRELGVSAPSRHVPVWQGMLLAQIEEWKALFGKRPKLTREHVSILSSDREFDCTKAKKELGFSPRKIEDGI